MTDAAGFFAGRDFFLRVSRGNGVSPGEPVPVHPKDRAMSARTWVRKLFACPPVAPVARPRRRPHLGVEALEDRAVPATFTVTNLLDDGSAGSLRWAVAQANSTPGADTIDFGPAVAGGTITLTGGQLALTDSARTTIDGGTAGVTIDGNRASRVFRLDPGAGGVLSRLTITGGRPATTDYASLGGGILNYGTLTVANSTVTNNTSFTRGGGVFNYGTLAVVGSTVAGNTAGDNGGGVYIESGTTASVVNSTFTNNLANDGSAVYNAGTLSVTSSTLVNNSVRSGRLGTIYTTSGRTTTLTNTLLFNNIGFDLQGPGAHTGDYNLTGDGSAPGAHSLRNTNAQIGSLGDYGGPTRTVPVLANSPAIGAGVTVAGVTTDQRGVARPRTPSIGAYEGRVAVPSLVVTTTGDEDDGTSDPLYGSGTSLREALAYANANPGADTVTFAPAAFGTPQTITLSGGQLALTDAARTTIDGGNAGVTISGGNATRVFQVGAFGNTAATATLADLTLTGGNDPSGGGAVFNYGTLALTGGAVAGNRATFTGGGVYNTGTLTVTGTVISGNSASAAGGVFNTGTLTVTGAVFDGNTANGSIGGGGLWNDTIGTAVIAGTTFRNNTVPFGGGGGGILSTGAGVSVSGSTFSGNLALTGGGISNNAALSVTNSTLHGNTGQNRGGGIANGAAGTLTAIGVTVAGNTATNTGAGIANDAGGTATLWNVLAVGNPGAAPADVAGPYSGVGSLIGVPAGKTLGQVVAVDGTGKPVLADNGGPTKTVALAVGSPAINRGQSFEGVTTDQRGLQRNGRPDIGAFEDQSLNALGDIIPAGTDLAQKYADLANALETGDPTVIRPALDAIVGSATDAVTTAGSGVDLNAFIELSRRISDVSNAVGDTTPVPLDAQVVYITNFVALANTIPGGLTGGSPLVQDWKAAGAALLRQNLAATGAALNSFNSTATDLVTTAGTGVDIPRYITLVSTVVNLTNAIGATTPVPDATAQVYIENFVGLANNIPGGLTGGNPLVAYWKTAGVDLLKQDYAGTVAALNGFNSAATDLLATAGSGVTLDVYLALTPLTVNLTNALGATTPVPLDAQVAYITNFIALANAIPGGLKGGDPLMAKWAAAGTALLKQDYAAYAAALRTLLTGAIIRLGTPADAARLADIRTAVNNLFGASPVGSPVVTLTSSVATPVYGDAGTLTALAASPAVPGVVVFYVDGAAFGAPVAVAAGVPAVSLDTQALTAGDHAIAAVFTAAGSNATGAQTRILTVGKRGLTITAANESKTYGATFTPDGATRFTTGSGQLVNGDAVTAVTLTSAGYAASAAVASSPYAIIPSAANGTGLGNYQIAYVNGTLTVDARHLTGSFTARSREYDGTTGAEVLTRSLSNAVSGDAVSLAGGTAAFADPNAGTGKIVTLTGATLTGTAAGNYVLDGVAAAAADITRARLTVRADDKQKVFGQAVPARTYTITGFVGGETLATSGVTGAPALSTTATAASRPGAYPIAVGIGTLAAGNYDFPNLIAGTLTVDKAATAVGLSLGAASPLRGTDGLTLTAVVSVVAPGAGTPTGTVAFKAGPVTLGTAAVGANGAATLTLSAGQLAGLLAAGSYQVTASYGGDDTFDPAAGPAAPLAVVAPAAVQGVVYVDFNNDGEVDFGERGIATVKVTLTGTDDLGQAVTLVTYTDAAGVYSFTGLRPSPAGYRITESQPSGWVDGRDSLGTVGGVYVGAAGNDVLSGVVLAAGQRAENYNFGERPAATGLNVSGQAAGIGFWQNKNGQKLLYALNGGGTAGTATQLGNWLAATFPNMYAGLAGKTNAQVAGFYKQVFALNGNTAPAGAPKTDAQVLATALAVYVTNQSLAGTTAASYGFRVTTYGLGAAGLTLGGNGVAFGLSGTVSVTVMDLLLAVNDNSRKGVLFDTNGDGRIDFLEGVYRTIANDVFGAINELGGI